MTKAAGLPLWALLGGRCRCQVPRYDTNCGWLGYSLGELIDNVKRAVDDGFRGVKIKIEYEDFGEDLRRLEAGRRAVGPEVLTATDVNNGWDL